MLQFLIYTALFVGAFYVPTSYDVLALTCGAWTPNFRANVEIQLFRPLSCILFGGLMLTALFLMRFAKEADGCVRGILQFFPIAFLLFFGVPVWFTLPHSIAPNVSSLNAALGTKGTFMQDVSCHVKNASFPVAILNQTMLPPDECISACDALNGVNFCCVTFDLQYPVQHVPQTLLLSDGMSIIIILTCCAMLAWSLLKLGYSCGQLQGGKSIESTAYVELPPEPSAPVQGVTISINDNRNKF